MIQINPVTPVEVRCKNSVIHKATGQAYRCNALLAKVEEGKGTIRCRRCKHMNHYEVIRSRSV